MSALKFSNQGGFPLVEVVNISESGTVTTLNFNNHPYRLTNRFYGGFFVKVPQAVAAGGTNTLEFATIGVGGSNVPVYLPNGTQATAADIESTGPAIYLAFYDRDNNRIQLIGVQ